MKIIYPNKDMLKTIDELLAHNRKILEMNSKIVEALCTPAIMLPDKEKNHG